MHGLVKWNPLCPHTSWMETLPDLLCDPMSVLSVGLNPSIPSVKAGFYFANPRNRFWKALNQCGFFKKNLTPSLDSCQYLLEQYQIGFTDLVKRPTPGCKELRADDYRTGSNRLQILVNDIRPQAVWFHGKLTCQKYLQYGSENKHSVNWGLQSWAINNQPVYVTPNPSPANAAFSLTTISDSYADLLNRLCISSKC